MPLVEQHTERLFGLAKDADGRVGIEDVAKDCSNHVEAIGDNKEKFRETAALAGKPHSNG